MSNRSPNAPSGVVWVPEAAIPRYPVQFINPVPKFSIIMETNYNKTKSQGWWTSPPVDYKPANFKTLPCHLSNRSNIQHGFREESSTIRALLLLVHKPAIGLNKHSNIGNCIPSIKTFWHCYSNQVINLAQHVHHFSLYHLMVVRVGHVSYRYSEATSTCHVQSSWYFFWTFLYTSYQWHRTQYNLHRSSERRTWNSGCCVHSDAVRVWAMDSSLQIANNTHYIEHRTTLDRYFPPVFSTRSF